MSTQYTLRTPLVDRLGLEVQMLRCQDRFASHLRIVSELEHILPILRSWEGDDLQSWPPSPAIQQLSRQEYGSGDFLAGVGMAGNSHWSLSVRALDTCNPTLEFDVACRVQEAPTRLESVYEILDGIPTCEDGRVVIAVSDSRLVVTPCSTEGVCDLTLENNRVCVVAKQTNKSYPVTVRWTYQMSVVRSLD